MCVISRYKVINFGVDGLPSSISGGVATPRGVIELFDAL